MPFKYNIFTRSLDMVTKFKDWVTAQIATHTAISDAHHTPTVAGDLNLNGLAEKNHASLANVTASQHHTKYTNNEAVSAVDTADKYVKNDANDTMNGNLTIENDPNTSSYPIELISSGANGAYMRTTSYRNSHYGGGYIFRHARGTQTTPLTLAANDFVFLIDGYYYNGSTWVKVDAFQVKYLGGTDVELKFPNQVNFDNKAPKNFKNHAHSALSGTKKLVEIDISGVSYYFEVYPTKA